MLNFALIFEEGKECQATVILRAKGKIALSVKTVQLFPIKPLAITPSSANFKLMKIFS